MLVGEPERSAPVGQIGTQQKCATERYDLSTEGMTHAGRLQLLTADGAWKVADVPRLLDRIFVERDAESPGHPCC
jgi:hypothetical protein